MADVIYHIVNNQNGHYIGQYHTNRFLAYHWDNCWKDGGTAPWEKEWLASVISTGMANSTYILTTHSMPEETMIDKIKNEISEQWFNAFRNWWGIKDDGETAEALLICLLFKDKSITPLNSQIVGMSDNEFRAFASGNISPEHLKSKNERALDKYGLDFHLIRTLTFENYAKLPVVLQQEFDDLTKHLNWKNGAKKLDFRKKPELRDFISEHLADLFDEHYLKDLEKYIGDFPKNTHVYKVLRQIANTLESQKDSFGTRTELIKALNKAWTDNNVLKLVQDYTKNKRIRNFGMKQAEFCDKFNEWYAAHSWNDYFPDTSENTEQQVQSVRQMQQRYFTDYVQMKIFNNPNIFNERFEEDRRQRVEGDISNDFMHYLTYYSKWYYPTTLRTALQSKAEQDSNEYLKKNWFDIYSEQAAIWIDLNSNDLLLKETDKRDYFQLPPIPSKTTRKTAKGTKVVYDIKFY